MKTLLTALLASLVFVVFSPAVEPASACRPATPEGVEFCKDLNNSFGKSFVVTKVEGSPRTGFVVTYDTGRVIEYVPRYKAIRACKKLGRRVDRVRCKATVRTEYRYLKILKKSLNAA